VTVGADRARPQRRRCARDLNAIARRWAVARGEAARYKREK